MRAALTVNQQTAHWLHLIAREMWVIGWMASIATINYVFFGTRKR